MKQDYIDAGNLISSIVLPILGWVIGARIDNITLTPFPEAVGAAIIETPGNPYLVLGIVLGALCAAVVTMILGNL